MEENKEDQKKDFSIGDFLQLAGSIPISILLGFFVGRHIDNKLRTQPVFLFVALIIGIISAYWSIFKIARRERKNNNEAERQTEPNI